MIEIDVSPNLLSGAVILSWHGVFAFAAVATAVFLVGRWARLVRVEPDAVYSIAVWAVSGGVIGARFFHVIDRWDLYSNTPWEALAFWQPGIAVWGGVLGGFAGGVIAALVLEWLRKRRWAKEQAGLPEDRRAPYEPAYPIGKIADITAPAMLFVLAVGRLGDIVNGEHCAKATDFFLGFVWTAPDTIARNCASGFGTAAHPTIAYEMLLSFGALWVVWKLRGRLRPDRAQAATMRANARRLRPPASAAPLRPRAALDFRQGLKLQTLDEARPYQQEDSNYHQDAQGNQLRLRHTGEPDLLFPEVHSSEADERVQPQE